MRIQSTSPRPPLPPTLSSVMPQFTPIGTSMVVSVFLVLLLVVCTSSYPAAAATNNNADGGGVAIGGGSTSLWEDCAPPSPSSRLLTFGLVADAHYDTFPAGEKAPWEPMQHWLQEQSQRTSNHNKRRYDVAKDKMEEAIEVFNKLYVDGGIGPKWPSTLRLGQQDRHPNDLIDESSSSGGRRMDMVVNLGDLVNNDLMWNLRPVLDVFNRAFAAHYHLLGNHDLRAHNDRFGKVNLTQHKWIQQKMLNNLDGKGGNGGSGSDGQQQTGWHFSVRYPPFFRIICIDSMVMEPETPDKKKRDAHLLWLRRELQAANDTGTEVVILFAHIPIGVQTNVMGPTIREFDSIVIAAFFGHNHKGGYLQQGNIHSITINGQIETLVNAFAVVELYPDRLELTGFGRVPSRVLKFTSAEALRRLSAVPFLAAVKMAAGSPDQAQYNLLTSYPTVTLLPSGEVASSSAVKRTPLRCWWRDDDSAAYAQLRPDLRRIPVEQTKQHIDGTKSTADGDDGGGVTSSPAKLFQPLPPPKLWEGVALGKEPPLQTPPPLQLNIVTYKKPLLPYVDANPGGTDLMASTINKYDWRTHRKRVITAHEDPVQLNDVLIGPRKGNSPGAISSNINKAASSVYLVNNEPVNGNKHVAAATTSSSSSVVGGRGATSSTAAASAKSTKPHLDTTSSDEGDYTYQPTGGSSDDVGMSMGWMMPSLVASLAVLALCGWRSCLRRRRGNHGGGGGAPRSYSVQV